MSLDEFWERSEGENVLGEKPFKNREVGGKLRP